MSSVAPVYTLGDPVRPNHTPGFPVGWLLLVIVLIIGIIIVLYFFFRQRTQLIEPSLCPKIKGRYAVRPGVTKTTLQSCGDSGSDVCQFPATTLAQAIERCELNHAICTEFSYDPTTQVIRIVNPSGTLQSTQQENLYLLQIGEIVVT